MCNDINLVFTIYATLSYSLILMCLDGCGPHAILYISYIWRLGFWATMRILHAIRQIGFQIEI